MAIVDRATLQGPVGPRFCLNSTWLRDLLDSYFNKASDDIRLPNWNVANAYNVNDKVIDPATGRVYIALTSVTAGTPLQVSGPNWRTYDPAIAPPNPTTIISVADISNPTELSTLGVADGPIAVAEEGADGAIWYNYVADPSLSPSAPYVMASADVGAYWVAFPQSSNAFNFALGASIRTQAVVNILSATELNSIPGTFATALLVFQTGAPSIGFTLYVYSPSAYPGSPPAPYVYSASGGGFWIAIAGYASQNGTISNGSYQIQNIDGANATFTNLTANINVNAGILKVGSHITVPAVNQSAFEGTVFTEGGINDSGNISSSQSITGRNISRQGTIVGATLNGVITLNPNGNIFFIPGSAGDITASTRIVLPNSSNYPLGTEIKVLFNIPKATNTSARIEVPGGDGTTTVLGVVSNTEISTASLGFPGVLNYNASDLVLGFLFTLVDVGGSAPTQRWVPRFIK